MSDHDQPFENMIEGDVSLKGKLKKPKFWLSVFMVVAGIFLLVTFYRSVIKDSMSPEEVMQSIEVVWYDTKWVDKEISPYEVKIVPAIVFKIKNTGKRTLQFVNFEGIFEFEENGKAHSDGFTQALKNPLAPGETSKEIFVKSFFGYSASSKDAFLRSKKEWKKMRAKIFASTRGSGLTPIGGPYPVKQVIEGVEGDFTMDEGDSKMTSSAEWVAKSMEVVWQDSKWLDKEVTKERVIVVPSIRVKVKNNSDKPIRYVYFKGQFLFIEKGEEIGEGITFAFKKPLSPGETSDEILIRSDFGYSASSKESFFKDLRDWKKVKVKLYAKIQRSDYALLGIYPIKQVMEGIKINYL